jgi:hypothetical protein
LFGKQALGCKNNVAKLKSFVYFLQFHQLQLIGLICTKAKSDFKDLLKSMGADGFPACWIIRFSETKALQRFLGATSFFLCCAPHGAKYTTYPFLNPLLSISPDLRTL